MWMSSTWIIYYLTVSTEIATPPKSAKSRISDFSVSRGTNSNWDLVQFKFVCRGIQVPRFGGVLGCSIFRGICHIHIHIESILLIYIVSILFEIYESGAYRYRRYLPIVQSDRERSAIQTMDESRTTCGSRAHNESWTHRDESWTRHIGEKRHTDYGWVTNYVR